MRRPWLWIVAALVIIAAVAAVITSGDNNKSNKSTNPSPPPPTSTTPPSSSSNQANEVTIKNMIFSPSQVTIQKGDKVTWTNNDSVAHTVISDTGSELKSDTIEPGESFSHTFDTTGSFQYHCSIHPSMRGTIVVR